MKSGRKNIAKVILVLHAHLPYIRIPDKKFPLQELWLFQILTECYIPLLKSLNELININCNFHITLSLSPTLLTMLGDDYFKKKYNEYLILLEKLLRKSSKKKKNNSFIYFADRAKDSLDYYNSISGNILDEFKKLSLDSRINLITTSATHAVLPLFRFNNDFINDQINIGLNVFRKCFGRNPDGFWLPEMAYYVDLDKILKKYKLNYTFLDAHSIYYGNDDISYGSYYPSITGNDLTVFPRDIVLSKTIWSSRMGYPGDYRYREFHFDYTYSLKDPELGKAGIKNIPFGLKIYRITGKEDNKDFYDRDYAMSAVREHSDNFISRISERAEQVTNEINRTPVFTLPFDAELFGHWWYEGIDFLKSIIKKLSDSNEIELVSPGEFSGSCELETITPSESSWGNGGFFDTWLNSECSWLYPEVADLYHRLSSIKKEIKSIAAAEKAKREILLAASSDWPFLIANDNFRDYAKYRIDEHISAAKKIIDSIEKNKIDAKFIKERDSLYPVFND